MYQLLPTDKGGFENKTNLKLIDFLRENFPASAKIHFLNVVTITPHELDTKKYRQQLVCRFTS